MDKRVAWHTIQTPLWRNSVSNEISSRKARISDRSYKPITEGHRFARTGYQESGQRPFSVHEQIHPALTQQRIRHNHQNRPHCFHVACPLADAPGAGGAAPSKGSLSKPASIRSIILYSRSFRVPHAAPSLPPVSPNAANRDRRVVGFTPNNAAAPDGPEILPLAATNAR